MNDGRTRKHTRFTMDTSALLCFLDINRTDLLKRHPATFLATTEVGNEILRKSQRARYRKAMNRRHFIKADEPISEEELRVYSHLTNEKGQGEGESSAIAYAITRKRHGLLLEDKKAIRHANRLALERNKIVPILRVKHILADLVRRKIVSVAEVDALLQDLAKHHKFRLKIGSIREVL